jgi:hypothetical protein
MHVCMFSVYQFYNTYCTVLKLEAHRVNLELLRNTQLKKGP